MRMRTKEGVAGWQKNVGGAQSLALYIRTVQCCWGHRWAIMEEDPLCVHGRNHPPRYVEKRLYRLSSLVSS